MSSSANHSIILLGVGEVANEAFPVGEDFILSFIIVFTHIE